MDPIHCIPYDPLHESTILAIDRVFRPNFTHSRAHPAICPPNANRFVFVTVQGGPVGYCVFTQGPPCHLLWLCAPGRGAAAFQHVLNLAQHPQRMRLTCELRQFKPELSQVFNFFVRRGFRVTNFHVDPNPQAAPGVAAPHQAWPSVHVEMLRVGNERRAAQSKRQPRPRPCTP
jgi:hypothetical protein